MENFCPIDLIVVLWKISVSIDLIVVLWKISVSIDLVVVLRKILFELTRFYGTFPRFDHNVSVVCCNPRRLIFSSFFFCRHGRSHASTRGG
jgi:hypothetical protein